jgi:hypothetical protein
LHYVFDFAVNDRFTSTNCCCIRSFPFSIDPF